MPRKARQHGESGFYHILFQGPSGRPPFWEKEDRDFFASLLQEKRSGGEYLLYAYAVLPDRTHFLLKEGRANLERITKRLGITYAAYYQKKYAFSGKVFYDRYKSLPLKDEVALKKAIRCVHALGLEGLSSAPLYRDLLQGMLDLPEIFSLLESSADPFSAAEALLKPLAQDEAQTFLQVADPHALQEAEAAALWRLDEFLKQHRLDKAELAKRGQRQRRIELLALLKEDERLSGRHLAKLTGLNRETVRLLLGEIMHGERIV